VARRGARNSDWAERFRKSDLEVLTDSDVRAALAAREIALISAKDVSTA
jgi:predicted glycoside hydrolase/deacetylase ChbG (UPF0249 family)